MADTDYISVRRLRTFLAQIKQWVLGFAANRNTQAMSDVTKDTGISGTVTIGKSITIHTASGAQTANVMNADMIVGEKPTTNKDLASKAPTINLVDSMVMEAVSDAFDGITTIEYQSVNNAGKLPQVGQAGVIYLCSVWEEVENPTGNPHDLGYYVYTNGEYVLTTDTSVQSGTTYYTKAMATDEYIWLASENRYEPLGQAKVDLTGLLFAGSATPGGTAYKAAAIPFGRVDSTSTSTKFTASVEGITALEDGVCVLLQNGVVASASGFTININNLGAHPCFNNMTAATRDTTIFAKDYTMLMVYDATRVVDGITGAWCCYRGYDANTNTIGYQVRTNSATLPVKFTTYRYRLYFTSADGTHWVGANASTSTNATSSRTPTSEKINPFGPIIYYSTNGTTNASANLTATTIWQQYTVTLGYSFNHTGAALVLEYPKPVYLKCEPQSDGSVKIAGSSTVASYVQELPTTEDGFVYIFLGIAYAATTMELRLEHPVYYFKDGAIRVWVNQAQAVGKVELEKYNSDATESSEGTPANGQTDVKVDNVSIGTVVTSYAPGTAQRPYVAPSWYALNTKLSDKQDTISDLNEIRSGASKGSTAVQPTDIKDELDPGGNGEIADSAAIAAYIEEKTPTKPITSTDNAIARYDGTSGNLQNSGVTINDSNHVTATKFITSGGTSAKYVKGDGSLDDKVLTSDLKEPDYTLSGKTSLTAFPLVNTISGNVFALLPPGQVIIEKTTDGGTTWEDAGVTDANKKTMFLGNESLITTLTIPLLNGIRSKQCGLRITVTAMKYNVPDNTSETNKYQYWNSTYVSAKERYASIENVYFWVSSKTDYIRVRAYAAKGNDANNWVAVDRGNNCYLNGDTGGNFIALQGGVFGGSITQQSQYWNYRFILFTDGLDGGDLKTTNNTSSQYICRIQAFGQRHWTSPNNIMAINHLYRWDYNQNATFPAKITSTGFVKSGGTSSQFLKADGSVDSNTYLTAQDISGKADKSAQSVTSVSNNETYNIVEGKKVTIATNGGTSDVDVVQLGSVKGAPSATSSAAAKEIPTWQGVKEYVQTNSPAPQAGDGIDITGSTISLKTASTSEVGGIKSVSVDVEPNIYKVTVDASEQTAEVPIPNASTNKTGVLTKEDFATFSGKQDALTFDPAPTINSTRPVTSGGVYEALEQKADKSNTYTKTEVNNLVSTIHNDVIIGALPSTGVANKIYRVPGTNSYADYAWDGTQFVKLAEFAGSIFVQLTEAQYDALSDTEKNNGTWYFIEEE